jgi:nascent polypeptide-associated complex subunit beta
MSGLRLLDLLA